MANLPLDPKTNQPLDASVVALAKAIRTQESGSNYNAPGKSGEKGAYQWMSGNFENAAKQYGLNPTDFSPVNQDKVAYYQLKDLKNKGYTPEQVAASWNAGEGSLKGDKWKTNVGTNSQGVKYDTPSYVSGVIQHYQKEKDSYLRNKGLDEIPTEPTPNESGAPFPSSPDDSGFTAGLKALGNTPSSALNFGKGILNMINPLNIIKNIAQIPQAYREAKEAGATPSSIVGSVPQATYESLVPQGIQSLLKGDVAGASKKFTEDPFGQVAPVVLTALGGAKGFDTLKSKANMADYIKNIRQNTLEGNPIPLKSTAAYDALDTGISKVGGAVTSPISSLIKSPLSMLSKVTRSATAQLIGLEPESITKILSNPKEFSKIAQDQASRGSLAEEFGSAVNKAEESLQETGEAYNPIREATTPVAVPPKFVDSVLSEYGLKVKKGEVTADTNSITRNTADLKALQNFYDNWGNKKSLTPSEYLNMRKDIAGIAKFGKEIGTNADAQVVGTKLYERANQIIRPKIKGLKELDDQFSPQKQQFNQIKKDFLQKGTDGEYRFKDGAINKIANAASKGKDALLQRMEEVMPGITKKIEILKTIEDIQKAYGNKVGTYTRGVIGGGALLYGNVPAVIATIISNPAIAVPLLRSLGFTAAKVGPIIQGLKVIVGDINKLKIPEKAKPNQL